MGPYYYYYYGIISIIIIITVLYNLYLFIINVVLNSSQELIYNTIIKHAYCLFNLTYSIKSIAQFLIWYHYINPDFVISKTGYFKRIS